MNSPPGENAIKGKRDVDHVRSVVVIKREPLEETADNSVGPVASSSKSVPAEWAEFMRKTKGNPPAPKMRRPFKCHYCPQSFDFPHVLNRHLLTHSGKKPFHCPKCQKGFLRKDYLDKHRRTHTGEKPFQCHLCNERLSQRSHLIRHLKKKHGINAEEDVTAHS